MDYQRLIQSVRELDFIQDDEKAEDALKTIVGVLLCKLDEADARRFAQQLPEQLSYDALVDQEPSAAAYADDFTEAVRQQFDLSENDARTLVDTVLHGIKDGLDEDMLWELEDRLPSDWVAVLEEA